MNDERLTVGELFAGIGGIGYGLERAGMRVAWQCEIDEWCQRVLAKYWSDVARYSDVRDLGRTVTPEPVDVLAGGFPCQPVSNAGARRAQLDDRWLWPEFARLVRLLRPRYVLVENVPGLLTRGMGDVLGDLAASGYDAEWECISAAAVGAPHRRDRVWIVAYPDRSRPQGYGGERRLAEGRGPQQARRSRTGSRTAVANADEAGRRDVGEDAQRIFRHAWGDAARSRDIAGTAAGWWAVEPGMGRVAHGVPRRVDRLRGLGNAVVPQVVEVIGRLIVEDAVS